MMSDVSKQPPIIIIFCPPAFSSSDLSSSSSSRLIIHVIHQLLCLVFLIPIYLLSHRHSSWKWEGHLLLVTNQYTLFELLSQQLISSDGSGGDQTVPGCPRLVPQLCPGPHRPPGGDSPDMLELLEDRLQVGSIVADIIQVGE